MRSKQAGDNINIYFLIITYINLKIMMVSMYLAINIYKKQRNILLVLVKTKGWNYEVYLP